MATNLKTLDSSSDVDAQITRAIDACVIAARAFASVKLSAEEHLRAVRLAGEQLRLVHRSVGGRPKKNLSRSLTSFQAILTRAHITRQTAGTWQGVAEIADDVFEQYLTVARQHRRTPTMADLFEFARPDVPSVDDSADDRKLRARRFWISNKDYRTLIHQLDLLASACDARTSSSTLIAIVARAYADRVRTLSRPVGSPTSARAA